MIIYVVISRNLPLTTCRSLQGITLYSREGDLSDDMYLYVPYILYADLLQHVVYNT